MGFDEGVITLDSPNRTYYSGQTIFGTLEFTQDKPKTFRGIYVKVKGFAHTHWTTSDTERGPDGKTRHLTINHDGHEDYFNSKQFLVGANSGECHLQPGKHKFSFECRIPENCPSSFEGEYGHIRYKLKIVVDRAYKFDQEKEIDITVMAPLNLNMDSYCSEPMEFDMEESYCCWCMDSGIVQCLVKLPVSGYCPGQVIPIEISCANKSSVKIDKISLAIKKDTFFRAHHSPGSRNGTRETIAVVKKGPIPGKTTRSWMVEMEVPALVPSNLANCHIIDLDYYFKVHVVTSGCHEDNEEERKLVIGSIPLEGFQDDIENPLKDQLPQQQVQQSLMAPPMAAYPPKPHFNAYDVEENPYPPPYSADQPWTGANPPYPGANPPYPGANPPYPGANPTYPGANPPYPCANPPYPGANPPYPGANPPYPGVNPPYPGANTLYPGANPPYPGVNPLFPASTSPNSDKSQPALNPSPAVFPAQPPYPTNMPMPLSNPISGVYGWSAVVPAENVKSEPSAPEPAAPDARTHNKLDDKGVSFDAGPNYPYNPSVVPPNQPNEKI